MHHQYEREEKNNATSTPTNHKLREQALEYWRLSQAKNGRGSLTLTTAAALERLNILLGNLGPKRYLKDCAGNLMADIISPTRKRKAKKLSPPTPIRKVSN